MKKNLLEIFHIIKLLLSRDLSLKFVFSYICSAFLFHLPTMKSARRALSHSIIQLIAMGYNFELICVVHGDPQPTVRK